MNKKQSDGIRLESSSNEKQRDNNLSIIINENTNKFLNSSKNSDIIQCALEYNNYLINYINNNKHKMTIAAFEKFTDKLYDNLSLLANHCDNFRKKYKLCKEGENSTHKNQSNEMKNKENITKMETRRSALRSNTVSGIDVSNTNKGIVLTIDKSKLNL